MDDICNHYGIARPTNLGLNFGLPTIPGVGNDETHSEVIAASLRVSGRSTWRSKRDEIRKSELPPELAMWMMFVKTNIVPSTHFTNVDPFVARILYCLQHNLPMDIGHIIQLEMVDAAAPKNKGILPFPSLVTAMCIRAGIHVNDITASPLPFDHRTFASQVAAARKLARSIASANEEMEIQEGSEEAEEFSHEEEDYGEDARAGWPAWGRELRQELIDRDDARDASMDYGFQQIMLQMRAMGRGDAGRGEGSSSGGTPVKRGRGRPPLRRRSGE